jgi:hypothetical protein
MNKKSPWYPFSPTECFVLETLQHSQLTLSELVQKYARNNPTQSKQSVYKAVQSLRKREVLTGTKNALLLSNKWLNLLETYLQQAKPAHDPLTELLEGDDMSYLFTNFALCDVFLGHIHKIIVPRLEPKSITVFHNPHQWFFITRPKSESEVWQDMVTSNILCCMTVFHKTALDISIGSQHYATNKELKFSIAPMLTNNRTYLAVLGDYLYTVTIEQWRADAIDAWYQTYTTITPENTRELSEIINKRGRIKVKILRNKKKATEWRKKIGKYFLIPKGYEL